MLNKKEMIGKPSVIGNKGFHYPDVNANDIVVPEGAYIQELNWISGDSHRWVAYAHYLPNEDNNTIDDLQIVWVKRNK